MRKRIVIADASDTIISVCKKLLAQNNYEAVLFQDGTKALEELKRTDCDLAVIATTTLSVTGYFIVKELRRDRAKRKIPILMLLGSSELLDTKELVDAAPDDTLSKPFSPQELLFKMQKLLKLPVSSQTASDDSDIESVLNDDDKSFEKKISSATDKIFLSALAQGATPSREDKPKLDKLDLAENQYEFEGAPHPHGPDSNAPHDYDWFINEMKDEPARKQEPKPVQTPPPTGKFQVEEIGTSKIAINQIKKMQEAEEVEKTKAYFERLNEPGAADHAYAAKLLQELKAHDPRTEFMKFFAEALAKELSQNIDFQKLLDKIEEIVSVKQTK